MEHLLKEEKELVESIKKSNSNSWAEATLKTDERVIARVTDGIYRQPGSALRELISNAYDADATQVVIKTDAPRFERITVEDNGHGMTPETLAHMLLHIGGSAKRHNIGKNLGITSAKDPLSSPGGRKLIGKIGIGIFSVSQLTHNFQIITKTKGDNFRTIATVALKQYSDESVSSEKGEDMYESGRVNIWREKAKDTDTHGTTIVLTNIKPQARNTLRSTEMWASVAQSDKSQDEFQSIEPPKYYVGQVDEKGELLVKRKDAYSNVPWGNSDTPSKAFHKLVQCVWDELLNGNRNPKLDNIFDYYLKMVWDISLSIPIPYVEGHLFDMDSTNWAQWFLLSNAPKGSASPVLSDNKSPIRKQLGLSEGKETSKGKFEVLLDDLNLSRPIKYKGLPTSDHAIKHPLVFLGKCREEFIKHPRDLSGGALDFEAYLFWTPKLAPTEHRGVLIRINGASGTLFDPSFMRYQVSEQTRLSQIVCEIFIHEGFDSALNIDRESFNYAHPHAVFLTRWLHSALRQLATAQKGVAAKLRVQERSQTQTKQLNEIQEIANTVWKQETNDEDSSPPTVGIENEGQKGTAPVQVADITYKRSVIAPKREGKKSAAKSSVLDEKLKAIVQVLASFGLLDALTKSKQERLLKAIYQILETSEE